MLLWGSVKRFFALSSKTERSFGTSPNPRAIREYVLAEIAIQSDVARGTPPGQGIDAGVSLHFLGQQNEQQMARLESAVKKAYERVCTKVLETISRYFSVQRTLAIPGVYGVEEVNNFVGSMLRGATRVRVSGSLLPRNNAAQMQVLLQLAGAGAVDVRQYLSQLTEGRISEIGAPPADSVGR